MKKLIIYGFACFIISTLQAQPDAMDLASGLMAYYSFDEKRSYSLKEGATDVILKGAEWKENRFGFVESALSFDGVNQQVLIPASGVLDVGGGEGYTLSLWLQPRDDNQGCVLLKEGDFGIKWNGMRKPLTVFNGLAGGFPSGTYDNWSSDEWYHIVLVKLQNRLGLYINGNLDQSWPITAKQNVKAKPIYLGKHPYFWGGFSGTLDDVSLYNRALNEYEIIMLSQIENIPLENYVEIEPLNKDLSEFIGNWEGVISQPGNAVIPNYAFSIRFKDLEDDLIKGYTRIEVPEDNAYGVISMQAFVSGNTLNFEEIRIYRQKNYLGYEWCKKYGQLKYDKNRDALVGKWYSNNCEDIGEIVLFRSENKFNYYDNRLSEPVTLAELETKLQSFAKDGKTSGGATTVAANTLKEEENINPTEGLKSLKINLNPIEFKFGNAEISAESKKYLVEQLLPILKKYPQLRLKISGYTDSSGDDQVNLMLSQARAKSIRDFIVQNQISKERLEYKGYGEANPIVPNTTPQGRKQNRRVEFEIFL
ncbi:MAG: OmpA family protein [Bacteroidota bacterium]